MKSSILVFLFVVAACQKSSESSGPTAPASQPVPEPTSASTTTKKPVPLQMPKLQGAVWTFPCACDVIEPSNRPDDPKLTGQCELVQEQNGKNATLRSIAGGVALQGALVKQVIPKDRADEHEAFVMFKSSLELSCDQPWCGQRQIDLMWVDNLVYQAAIERQGRSATKVLRLYCSPPKEAE